MRYLPGLAVVLAVLASCRSGSADSGKPVVGVTVLPQQYFVERIAGDLVEVAVMVPPGASPATYEPTPGQLSALNRAGVYLRIGFVEFEMSWLGKISSVNPDMKMEDLSLGVETIYDTVPWAGEHTGMNHLGIDPHIWMSLVNARTIAQNVSDALSSQFPEHSARFKINLEGFLDEIDTLHSRLMKELAPYQNRGFMIYHPALTYFARDYHLKQYSLEIEGKTPSPAHMKRMTDLGLENRISTIFIQSQFDRNHAVALAGELGAGIVQIDPLDPEWLSQMEHIASQLKTAFNERSPYQD